MGDDAQSTVDQVPTEELQAIRGLEEVGLWRRDAYVRKRFPLWNRLRQQVFGEVDENEPAFRSAANISLEDIATPASELRPASDAWQELSHLFQDSESGEASEVDLLEPEASEALAEENQEPSTATDAKESSTAINANASAASPSKRSKRTPWKLAPYVFPSPLLHPVYNPEQGWFGQPDPDMYEVGTNMLTEKELEHELAKGWVMRVTDLRNRLRNLTTQEKKLARAREIYDELKHRCFVKLDDQTVVSVWDLYVYYNHNPELQMLLERNRRFGRPEETLMGRGVWNPEAMMMQPLGIEAALEMPWGLLTLGKAYKRRPTRWFKNVDGVLDFTYSSYAHEARADAVLSPRWSAGAGVHPDQALDDPSFYEEVVRSGPRLGLMFYCVAARELPLQQAARTWGERLYKILKLRLLRTHNQPYLRAPQPLADSPAGPASSSSTPSPLSSSSSSSSSPASALTVSSPVIEAAARQSLTEVMQYFEPEYLGVTNLLDVTGTRLREKTRIIFTMTPQARMSITAVSPGGPDQQVEWHLGEVHSPVVCEALADMFLGEHAMSEEFSRASAAKLLMYANGYRTGLGFTRTPAPLTMPEAAGERRFCLPPVGRPRHHTLLTGIKDRIFVCQAGGEMMQAAQLLQLAPPDAMDHYPATLRPLSSTTPAAAPAAAQHIDLRSSFEARYKEAERLLRGALDRVLMSHQPAQQPQPSRAQPALATA